MSYQRRKKFSGNSLQYINGALSNFTSAMAHIANGQFTYQVFLFVAMLVTLFIGHEQAYFDVTTTGPLMDPKHDPNWDAPHPTYLDIEADW